MFNIEKYIWNLIQWDPNYLNPLGYGCVHNFGFSGCLSQTSYMVPLRYKLMGSHECECLHSNIRGPTLVWITWVHDTNMTTQAMSLNIRVESFMSCKYFSNTREFIQLTQKESTRTCKCFAQLASEQCRILIFYHLHEKQTPLSNNQAMHTMLYCISEVFSSWSAPYEANALLHVCHAHFITDLSFYY